MTLFDILPSLRHAATPRIDRAIWPLTVHVDELGRLCVGEMPLTEVADEFGTPTYVVDEADFRHRIRRYRAALPDVRLVYAGKALLTTAVAQWVAEEGSGLGVSSGGELATALTDGHAARAVEWILDQPLLHLTGLHCHIGSQVTDASLYGEVIREIVPLMAEVRARHGVILTELNIGGGQGVPYVSGDPELDLDALRDFTDDALDASCAAERFPRPTIVVEPGRAISARAGDFSETMLRDSDMLHLAGSRVRRGEDRWS